MMKDLFLCAVLFSGAVFGAELFVSTSGNDENPGTAKAPFATIARAAAAAQPGDTVRIGPGLYREQITFVRSGKEGAPVTFAGTRGPGGEYLTVVEPPGRDLTGWSPAPEIGPEVWKAPLDKRPDLMLMDGFMITYINRRTMELPRRKALPAEMDEEMLWDKFGPRCRRLSGFDLLRLPVGIRQKHQYFHERRELFWDTIGFVLSGWREGMLYVRFADGGKPQDHRFTAACGSGFRLRNVSHLRFQDLFLRGSRIQFLLEGRSSHNTISRCLLMHGGSRVFIDRPVTYTTVRDCVLTAGFIRNDVFRLRKPDDMRGGMIYLVFKYIIGTALSDDVGVNDHGDRTSISGNTVLQGLIGIEAFGTNVEVRENYVREMASVGIYTGSRTTGKFHHNLVTNCGIPLRIHDIRHKRAYREEYHYCSVFVQEPMEGSQVWLHCSSHQEGPDMVNFEPGTRKYKKNPPAPVDAGKFYIYHNTFWGGNQRNTYFPPFPVSYLSERFRMAMPFHLVNNIFKEHCNWRIRAHEILAGNLFYVFFEDPKLKCKDSAVAKFNKFLNLKQSERIWKGGGLPGLPDLSLAPDSPALGTGVDVSRPFTVNGKNYPAFPGLKPGYFKGGAPAAGALQEGESMAFFNGLFLKGEKAVKMLGDMTKNTAAAGR